MERIKEVEWRLSETLMLARCLAPCSHFGAFVLVRTVVVMTGKERGGTC